MQNNIQMTFGMLLNMDNDLRSIVKNNPGLAFLLGERIDNFYNKYKHHLAAIPRKHNELLLKHTIHDENGKPKTIEKEDKSFEYLWATPSSAKAFEEESKEFLNRKLTLIAAV